MSRGLLMLLVIAIVTALALVTAQHRSRKSFIELETQQDRAKKLDEEYSSIVIEQSKLAAPKRVGEMAQSIGMVMPQAANTVVVRLADTKATATPQASSASPTTSGKSSAPPASTSEQGK